MTVFTKLKIYIDAYFAEITGVPLIDLIETRGRTLFRFAPSGEPPFYHSVQPDGKVITVEPVKASQEFNDRQVLRLDMGDTYADRLNNNASRAAVDVARHDVDIRGLEENIREHKERHDELLNNTPDHHFIKGEGLKSMLVFIVVVLGEIGALFFLFADFFGIDPMRLGREISTHPLPVLATAFFTMGFFAASLRVAHQVLHSSRRVTWIAALVAIAVLIGNMRAVQAAALQETDVNTWFMTLFYTTISLIFPLAGAYYAGKWKESLQGTGPVDSITKRLNELEARLYERLGVATKERTLASGQLDKITNEYVVHYQNAVKAKNKSRADWETFLRYVDAYLAELRLAYLFWEGWHARKLTVPRPVKRAVQVAAACLAFLMLFLISSRAAQADSAFNMALICDRSSSAGEYCCAPDKLEEAGRLWAEKASERGGGKFEVFTVDSGFDTTTVIFSEIYPERFPGPVTAHKKKWRVEFMHRLKAVNLPDSAGSAVTEVIYRASLRIPSDGQTIVYVLSDMREVDEAFNFEKQVPKEKEYTDWIEANAIMPKFNGSTRLVVCGMHPYSPDGTTRMTVQNYNKLLKLWQAVFKMWDVKATISENCDFRN